jgi:hypothetical protein
MYVNDNKLNYIEATAKKKVGRLKTGEQRMERRAKMDNRKTGEWVNGKMEKWENGQ